MKKKICLTETEFNILASGMRIEKLYAFAQDGDVGLSEQQINKCLFKLVKKGFLQIEQEQYVLTQELYDIFMQLKDAEYVLTIYTCDGKLPMRCIYMTEKDFPKVVSLELGNVVGSIYKLSRDCIDTVLDEALDGLFELSLLQEPNSLTKDEAEETIENDYFMQKMVAYSNEPETKLDDLCRSEGIVCIMTERKVEDEQIVKRLYLRSCTLYDEMFLQAGQEVKIYRFSKDNVSKMFFQKEKENVL